MSQIITTDLKHFDRIEEQEILNYVAKHNIRSHVSVFGLSGTGKTEMVSSSITRLHTGDFFSEYTILHFDAAQIPEDCSMDIFCNLLIYKLINYYRKHIHIKRIILMLQVEILFWIF